MPSDSIAVALFGRTKRNILAPKTTGLADRLRAELLHFDESELIRSAFIYGSVATGAHAASSDVDLLIAGSMRLSELLPMLRSFEQEVGREVDATVFTEDEFRAGLEGDQHFIPRVLSQPKIMLIADEDDLAGMGGGSVAP